VIDEGKGQAPHSMCVDTVLSDMLFTTLLSAQQCLSELMTLTYYSLSGLT